MIEEIKKDVEFLNEVAKPKSTIKGVQTFEVGKVDSRKFFKNKGIDKKTLQQVSDAVNDLINAGAKLASDKLVESGDDVIITKFKVNTDIGQYVSIASKKVRKVRNPRTGEELSKKGSLDIKCVIKPMLDKDIMEECRKSIEKVVKL